MRKKRTCLKPIGVNNPIRQYNTGRCGSPAFPGMERVAIAITAVVTRPAGARSRDSNQTQNSRCR